MKYIILIVQGKYNLGIAASLQLLQVAHPPLGLVDLSSHHPNLDFRRGDRGDVFETLLQSCEFVGKPLQIHLLVSVV